MRNPIVKGRKASALGKEFHTIIGNYGLLIEAKQVHAESPISSGSLDKLVKFDSSHPLPKASTLNQNVKKRYDVPVPTIISMKDAYVNQGKLGTGLETGGNMGNLQTIINEQTLPQDGNDTEEGKRPRRRNTSIAPGTRRGTLMKDENIATPSPTPMDFLLTNATRHRRSASRDKKSRLSFVVPIQQQSYDENQQSSIKIEGKELELQALEEREEEKIGVEKTAITEEGSEKSHVEDQEDLKGWGSTYFLYSQPPAVHSIRTPNSGVLPSLAEKRSSADDFFSEDGSQPTEVRLEKNGKCKSKNKNKVDDEDLEEEKKEEDNTEQEFEKSKITSLADVDDLLDRYHTKLRDKEYQIMVSKSTLLFSSSSAVGGNTGKSSAKTILTSRRASISRSAPKDFRKRLTPQISSYFQSPVTGMEWTKVKPLSATPKSVGFTHDTNNIVIQEKEPVQYTTQEELTTFSNGTLSVRVGSSRSRAGSASQINPPQSPSEKSSRSSFSVIVNLKSTSSSLAVTSSRTTSAKSGSTHSKPSRPQSAPEKIPVDILTNKEENTNQQPPERNESPSPSTIDAGEYYTLETLMLKDKEMGQFFTKGRGRVHHEFFDNEEILHASKKLIEFRKRKVTHEEFCDKIRGQQVNEASKQGLMNGVVGDKLAPPLYFKPIDPNSLLHPTSNVEKKSFWGQEYEENKTSVIQTEDEDDSIILKELVVQGELAHPIEDIESNVEEILQRAKHRALSPSTTRTSTPLVQVLQLWDHQKGDQVSIMSEESSEDLLISELAVEGRRLSMQATKSDIKFKPAVCFRPACAKVAWTSRLQTFLDEEPFYSVVSLGPSFIPAPIIQSQHFDMDLSTVTFPQDQNGALTPQRESPLLKISSFVAPNPLKVIEPETIPLPIVAKETLKKFHSLPTLTEFAPLQEKEKEAEATNQPKFEISDNTRNLQQIVGRKLVTKTHSEPNIKIHCPDGITAVTMKRKTEEMAKLEEKQIKEKEKKEVPIVIPKVKENFPVPNSPESEKEEIERDPNAAEFTDLLQGREKSNEIFKRIISAKPQRGIRTSSAKSRDERLRTASSGDQTLTRIPSFNRPDPTEHKKVTYDNVLGTSNQGFETDMLQYQLLPPIVADTNSEIAVAIDRLTKSIGSSSTHTSKVLFKRGLLQAKLGKYDEAVQDFTSSIHHDSYYMSPYWFRHQIYLKRGDLETALKDLDQITEHNKNHLGAFLTKAKIYQELGFTKLAIVNWSQVIRLQPNNPQAYYSRALLFELDGEDVYAKEDLAVVRRLDPTNIHALLSHATYCFEKKLWVDCIETFGQIISISPLSATAFADRARAKTYMADWEGSLRDINEAIRLDPSHYEFFLIRGTLMMERNKKQALIDLSTSIILDEGISNMESYYYRGLIYVQFGKYELALADFQTIMHFAPKNAFLQLTIGILYMEYFRDYVKALEKLNSAISLSPNNLRGYLCRGELYQIMDSETHGSGFDKLVLEKKQKRKMILSFLEKAIRDYSIAIHLQPSNHLLYLYRGRLLLKLNYMKAATADFNAAFKLNSSIAQTFSQRALVLSFQRKYDVIIKEYQENQTPIEDPSIFMLVAKARMHSNDFEGAIKDLSKAQVFAMSDPVIYLQRGICHYHLKSYESAIADFSKCIELHPYFGKAYYHRGLSRIKFNDHKGFDDLNKAIKIDPTMVDAYLTRAAYFDAQGLYPSAIDDCNECIRLEPGSIRGYLLRGTLRSKLGQHAVAIGDFTRATQLDRNCYLGFYNRAVAHHVLGNDDLAIQDYSIVLMLIPDSKAYRNRGLIYWKRGDHENALVDIVAAKNNFPGDAELCGLLALCLQKSGRIYDALKVFNEALVLNPFLIEIFLARGNAYMEMGNLHLARRDYGKALHLKPLCTEAYVNLAYTMQMEGKYKKAWAMFVSALKINPFSVSALEGRAMVHLIMKSYFAAQFDISKALDIMPKNPELLNNRGVILQHMGDYAGALKDFKEAIKCDTQYGLAYFNAGNMYFHQKSWDKAIEYYTLAINAKFLDESTILNRGIAFAMMNDTESAMADLNEVLRLNKNSMLGYFNRANLYATLGDYAQAESDYATVLTFAPTDSVVNLKHGNVLGKLGLNEEAVNSFAISIANEPI